MGHSFDTNFINYDASSIDLMNLFQLSIYSYTILAMVVLIFLYMSWGTVL
ncbi:MAG: hypothetical protein R2759_14470 [Bacteroidales bacterium]